MAKLSDLSAAVMTHPLRRRLATEVVESIRSLDPTVAVDPRPWDKPRTLRTSIKAWETVRPAAAYHLVIQDDALLSERFTEHLADILSVDPDRPVALFTVYYSRNGWAVRWASAWGARLVAAVPEYVPCLALLLPADAAREYVHFAQAWSDPDTPDDYVMKAYFAEARLEPLLTVPSIVEHRSGRSLIGNDFRNSAACLGDPPPGWFRTGGPILEGYRALPILKNGELWLSFQTRPGETRGDWEIVPFEAEAHRYGIDLDALSERYNDFLRGVSSETVDRWFALAHPRMLWTAWLSAYLLRNCQPPRTGGLAGPEPALLDWSLRTILCEFPKLGPDASAPADSVTALMPVVANGFATVGEAICLGP